MQENKCEIARYTALAHRFKYTLHRNKNKAYKLNGQ